MPYKAGQIAALRSTISGWMRLAIFEAMEQGEQPAAGSGGESKRLWFVVDELDALGQIDGLKDALARLRKFGGRCVLGFQSIAQVSSTYGHGDAHTIVENCGNTLIFRCSASEGGGTARFASQLIGDREVLRTTVSRSRRMTELMGSISHSEHFIVEPAVLPSQIEQLPDLTWISEARLRSALAARAVGCSTRLGRTAIGRSTMRRSRRFGKRSRAARAARMSERVPATDDATMKFGLLMESAQAHQKLADAHLEKLRAHTRDLDGVVREEIRRTFIEELQALTEESKRAAQALQGMKRAANIRGLLWTVVAAILCTAIPSAFAHWLLPSASEVASLRAERDRLTSSVTRLEQQRRPG